MGVKDLWNILSPLCERKPLFELQGKTIAIDLSCWVVDSQSITDNVAQPKMYLRNLYFRTAFLLMQDITPIFVLEGSAPTLKHKTIAKRNDIRNGFQERKTARKGGRTRFNRILAECQEMLKYMGIACVKGEGEAEAMCAYLNEDDLVHGCISQDSDCFLYGAKTVYRNFCTSAQGNRSGTGGSVDEYNIEKIESTLNLGRNQMIALALLCGCDYYEGINGVGKEAALKLFKIVDDSCILERIKSWRTDTSFDKVEAELLNPNICTSCGHLGKVQKHTKSGCQTCGTTVKCNDTYKEKRLLLLNEIQLRKKVLLVDNFPNQELIDEFLIRKYPVPSKLDLQWKQPQIDQYIHFVEKHLSWEPHYAFEKIFPLVTRWQLKYLPSISLETRLSVSKLFIPEKIIKVRNIRSVASYEIQWQDTSGIVDKLKQFYDDLNKENDEAPFDVTLLTIEPQNAVLECYPNLVDTFENARNEKKAKKRSANKKPKETVNNRGRKGLQESNGINKQQKKTRKKVDIKNNQKIDQFISTNEHLSLEESFDRLSVTPKRSKKHELNENEIDINVERDNVMYPEEKVKRTPQIRKVLEAERKNDKLDTTLDRMFVELSSDDFASDAEDSDLNMSGIIETICEKHTFPYLCTDDKMNNKKTDTSSDDVTTLKESKSSTQIATAISNTDSQCNSRLQHSTSNDFYDEFDDINLYVPIHLRVKIDSKRRNL